MHTIKSKKHVLSKKCFNTGHIMRETIEGRIVLHVYPGGKGLEHLGCDGSIEPIAQRRYINLGRQKIWERHHEG